MGICRKGGLRRGGTKYAGSYDIEEVAWYYGNSSSETHPVGQKKANELGLYDMSGNGVKTGMENILQKDRKIPKEHQMATVA